MPSSIILVKLGGSLITDKRRPRTPRRQVIRRLAAELARAKPQLKELVVVGHGSGSFGHVAAARFRLHEGVRESGRLPGVSTTQREAADLHRLVTGALLQEGLLPYSIAPSSALVADRGRPKTFAMGPLVAALKQGLLPVLYGDVVMDRSLGASICSTEDLFLLLCRRLPRHGYPVRRLLWLGETDGLLDARGRTIPRVSGENYRQVLRGVGAPAGTDVTGGMRHRLQTARTLARMGIESWLLNGRKPGTLEQALLGRRVEGTRIVPEIQQG